MIVVCLLAMLGTALSYFEYIPEDSNGGVFGQGPIVIPFAPMGSYVSGYGSMLTRWVRGEPVTIGALRRAVPSLFLTSPALTWIVGVFLALQVVALSFVGSTLARDPMAEMNRRGGRTTALVAIMLIGYVGYTMGVTVHGYAALGASSTTLSMGMDALDALEELRPSSSSTYAPILEGRDGQPVYFLALRRHARIRGINASLELTQ